MKLIAVVGLSGSGKTRLITRLIPEFRKRGLEVAVIKRCSREFLIDVEGKDSWRYREAGAGAVALTSPQGTAVLRKAAAAPDPRIVARNDLGRADVVLVEGGKKLRGLEKIEVVRREVGLDLLTPAEELIAVVADGPVATGRPVFGPEDSAALAEFLLARLEEEMADIRLEVDGRELTLNPFVRKIVENTVRGMVKSLNDVPADPMTIRLTIARREDDHEKS
ncbi:MAG: molybdopterin-guanine dinucleotide biosynthesis protein B [Candidatus Aminicenantes bacterium]|nr:molybdopterin-guanine dinucleotide biosynthesis protein B [Candidatus Aminicenantes bacterium]